MQQAITAANHLHIEFDTQTWRLVSQELDNPTTLVEVTPNGLVTHPVFRAARSLPSATITPGQIMRVMLGWAPESRAWRLGLLLIEGGMTKLDTTQMQWCELASWPEGVYNGLMDDAKTAGQTLARLLNRPFHFVEPHSESRVPVFSGPPTKPKNPGITDAHLRPMETTEDEDRPTHETEASSAPVVPVDIQPLPLPIRFEQWRLTRNATGLRWQRTKRWWWTHSFRIALFASLGGLFFLLGIGSRTRGLAETEPGALPTVGLGVGVLMLGLLLYALWQLMNASAVVVDSFKREVYSQGLLFPVVQWRVPFDQIQYVLISQSAPRPQGRARRDAPMRISQEAWLHVYDGADFHQLVELGEVEGESVYWDTVRTHSHTNVRRGLHLGEYNTPAHHAAQQIADIMEIPVYLDLV